MQSILWTDVMREERWAEWFRVLLDRIGHLYLVSCASFTSFSRQLVQHKPKPLSERQTLDILKRKARAAGLCTASLGRQLPPLLTLASILLDHDTFLATIGYGDDLDIDTLLDGLLKTRNHGAQGIELIESELAVEDNVRRLTAVETALQRVDEGHGLLGLGLVDLLAESLNVEVGVVVPNHLDVPTYMLVYGAWPVNVDDLTSSAKQGTPVLQKW
jgi:hypothetical protein